MLAKNNILILVSPKDYRVRYHVVRLIVNSEYDFVVVSESVGKFVPKYFDVLGTGCFWVCLIAVNL